MSSFENLPPEVFDIIRAELELESDIYHLLLTCKEMHKACIETLYRVNASNIVHPRSNQPHNQRPSALDWAIENDMTLIAQRVIEMTPEVCNRGHLRKALRMKDSDIAYRLLCLPQVQEQFRDHEGRDKAREFTWIAIIHGHIICLDILENLLPISPGSFQYLFNYIEPALAAACHHGHVELVKRFTAAGSRQCKHPAAWLRDYCLFNAIRYRGEGHESNRNYEMAKVLLNVYPKLATITSFLFAAAQEGHDSIAKLLLSHRARLPSNQDQLSFLLFEAIRGGCLSFVQTLLENGASIIPATRPRLKYPGFIPPQDRPHKQRQNAGIIEQLLAEQQERLSNSHGAGQYVLSEAISADNIPLVRYCVSAGAHIHNGHQALLSYHISSIEMLECLIEEGVNINSWDEDGILPIQKTLPLISYRIDDPLHFFNAFVSKVDDINATNIQGETVLSYYCSVVPSRRSYYDSKNEYQCIKERVKVLLNSGAKLDLASNTGRSPLHEAAEFSSKKVVSLLLKRGANSNALDNQGRSPLHSAMAHRCPEIVVKMAERLLKHGADPNHQDHKGTCALHIPASCVNPYYAEKLLHLYLSSQGIKVEGDITNDSDNETDSSSPSSLASDENEDKTQDDEADKAIKSLTNDFLWRLNDEGATPSVVVARDYENDAQDCIQFYLTDRGFDVPDAHGITPLAAAFLSCRTNLGEWLVRRHGADLNWLNGRGRTVLDILSEHSATKHGTSLSMSKYVARHLGGLTSRELADSRDNEYLRALLRGDGSEEAKERKAAARDGRFYYMNAVLNRYEGTI
ncbi:unnamed protein product [Clonostachys solani]|uniref:Uncharacterized protein n=1 Tax=Clonostachys solani TaxID=160281 RepID=A0A9N9WAW2_9HYPO|nr:unnamed protein product [Clonostachys solani]